jgi:hypothetical protein
MKKWIKNSLLVGLSLAGSLNAKSQSYVENIASLREIRKELGTSRYQDLKRVGYGYVTLADSEEESYFEKIKIIEKLNKSNIEFEGDGKTIVSYGPLPKIISKKTLENIDCIKKDYILTPEEIYKAFSQKYEDIQRNLKKK